MLDNGKETFQSGSLIFSKYTALIKATGLAVKTPNLQTSWSPLSGYNMALGIV